MRLFYSFVSTSSAWIYLHNPPGSNNRLHEESAQNKNPNRLFTSNNNRRGGYNVPDSTDAPAKHEEEQFRMMYFSGSVLRIEWSQLKGCDGPLQKCRVNIQVIFWYENG